jgi:hypothetical protein
LKAIRILGLSGKGRSDDIIRNQQRLNSPIMTNFDDLHGFGDRIDRFSR